MPSSSGSVRSDGSTLEGTFIVDNSPRYIIVDVKPPNQPFECSKATLTYDRAWDLSGPSNWRGRIGKDDLRMDFDGGVSIAGPLAESRLRSDQSRGAGTWSTVKASLPLSPGKTDNKPQKAPPRRGPVQDPAKAARIEELIQLKAPIIAVFGQSGVGKSTFINLITTDMQEVGTGLQSCTDQISLIEGNVGGQPIVVIDTPGIDDTRTGVREADVLISIAKQLGDMGKRKVWVTGVVFLHRISDNKFSQTADRVSTMIKDLCGDAAMSHLTLCTTMWDNVLEEEANKRFDELIETGAWKEMREKGASTAMISNIRPEAKLHAEEIVTMLIKNVQPIEVTIQNEIVAQKLKVAQTKAGKGLDKHLREEQSIAERELEEMENRLREESQLNAAKAQEEIHAREVEVLRLKTQAEEQARSQELQVAQLKRKQEKAKRETRELRDRIRSESEADAAILREQLVASEKELALLKQQVDELEGDKKVKAKEFKQKRKSAEQAKKETQKNAQREATTQAAKMKEELSIQRREIDDAKRQVDTLAGKPQRSGLLKLLGLS